MHSDRLAYAADGLEMASEFFVEDSGCALRPGVLVFPDAFGLGEHARGRAERLAGLGYAALACDLHGGGTVMTDFTAVMALIKPMREAPGGMRARAQGALDALRARPEVDAGRVGAIGFCFGGTMALELARSGADLAAVVTFHGGLATVAPAAAGTIRGKVLVCTGAEDPSVDAAQRRAFEEEMRAAEVNWQMDVYGGAVHAFTNPAADAIGNPAFARYDPQADARSWAAMRMLFDEVFAR